MLMWLGVYKMNGIGKNQFTVTEWPQYLNITLFCFKAYVLEGLDYLGIDLSIRAWRAHVENAELHCICHS